MPSPFCIKLPQMNAYTKYFDKNICMNTCMNFEVNDEKILKKYNEIWDKIKNLFEKLFNSEPMNNDKYIKSKVKIYNDKG